MGKDIYWRVDGVVRQGTSVGVVIDMLVQCQLPGVVVVDESERPMGIIRLDCLLAHVRAGAPLDSPVEQLPLSPIQTTRVDAQPLKVQGGGPVWAVTDDQGRCIGVATVEHLLRVVREHCIDVEDQLQAILDAGMGSIFVADAEGRAIRVSRAFYESCGAKEDQVIGRHVKELEDRRLFYPSVTLKVLKSMKRESAIQDTRSGRKHLAVGVPVFDAMGSLRWVVTVSRDVTELITLRQELEEAQELVRRYNEELMQMRANQARVEGVVIRSRAMQELVDLAYRIAQVDSTVLLLGETGVGKELFAKMIHNVSPRKGRPFLTINCGAIPDQLLESELFGYERGAFTGAAPRGKPGLFELATSGTVLLDEVAELPVRLQVKLLQLLQERKIMRVGGTSVIPIDVRILAATNRDIEAMVRAGQFREDLYYRLNVIPVRIPPLRERPEDIPELARYFLARFNQRYGKNKEFAEQTYKAFLDYDWPGNVRELENMVERLAATVPDAVIGPENLPACLRAKAIAGEAAVTVHRLVPLREAVRLVEKQLLNIALERSKSTYEAARLLGIDQSTVVRKRRVLGSWTGTAGD